MISKTQKKIIITTGTKTPNIIKKVKSSLDSNKIKFLDNQNFNDLEQIVSSISTNIGLNPACRTEAISEDQVKGGTITSPPSG